MAKINYLERVSSGVYYYRRRVPSELLVALKDEYPNGFIKKSLRTKDHKKAKEESRLLSAELDQKFANLCSYPVSKAEEAAPSQRSKRSIATLDSIEIRRIVQNWRGRESQQLQNKAEANAYKGMTRKEIDQIFDNVVEDYNFWCNNDEESALYVKREHIKDLAVSLLEAEGIAPDFQAPRFIEFRNLLLRGQKQLIAETHERLVEPWQAGKDPFFTAPTVQQSYTSIAAPVAPANARITLGELVKGYLADPHAQRKTNSKTRGEYTRHMNFILEYFGKTKVVASITRQDMKQMLADLEQYPARAKKRSFYKGKTIQQCIAIRGQRNGELMAVKTIENRMDLYSTLFKYAESEFSIYPNPAKGLKPLREDEPKEENTRVPFTVEHLNQIFSPANYLPMFKRISTPDDFYWVPLLGFYTGMRRSEVCQLHCDDISEEDGIPYIQVQASKGGNEDVRHIKSKAAKRRIPIHEELQKLGFLEFAEKRKTGGKLRLFDNIKYGDFDNRYRHFGEWFMRYLDKIGVKNSKNKVVFHSFRHSFRDAMLNNDIDTEMRRALGGWADDDANTENEYGKGFSLIKRNEALQKVTYPGLDLSHLYKR